MSKRLGVLLQNFPVNRVLRASVTVLIARPDDLATSCGLIGPSLSSLSSTISVLFVRLIGTLILTTHSTGCTTGQRICCQKCVHQKFLASILFYILPVTQDRCFEKHIVDLCNLQRYIFTSLFFFTYLRFKRDSGGRELETSV